MRRSIDTWLPTLNSLLGLLIRAIGAIGLVCEIFVDHFRNPTAIVVFGGIAGGQDSGWVPLQLASGVIAATGYYPPCARLRDGVVQLKGAVQNNTGGSTNGGIGYGQGFVWATVPASMVPSATLILAGGYVPDTVGLTTIDVGTGHIHSAASTSTGQAVNFDGLIYTLQ